MHNREKNQSIKTDKELMTSVKELVDKDIKIIILNIPPCVQKQREGKRERNTERNGFLKRPKSNLQT